MTRASSANLSRWARVSLLAITLGMGAALTASALANYRSITRASDVIAIGQSESLFREYTERVMEGGDLTAQGLGRLLARDEAAGLRYVELRDEHTRVHAGVAVAPISETLPPKPGPFQMQRVAGRVRVTGRAPPRHGDAHGPPHARPHAHSPPPEPPDFSHGPGPMPDRPGSQIILEFEPLLSNGLEAQASRALRLSGAVAAAFLLVTAALWRLLRQREQAALHAEQERRLTLLGEMSAVLAHEIKNPLASLKGHAQLLSEQLESGTATRKKADRVVHEAQRIEQLSNTLLDFVRSASIERQPVSPSELVARSAESVEAPIEIDDSDAPPSWSLDPLRMQQVLVNLLENARQASAGAAPVKVRIWTEREWLWVSVLDAGKGLAPGDEERIFQPFYSTRTHGVGLGLVVARRIVELHGGSLRAHNRAGGGASFTLSIPKEA